MTSTMQVRGSFSWRLAYLIVLAAGVGTIAGGAAYLLEPSPRLVIAAVVGALIVASIARWEPLIRGHGIPEAI
ncbi:MAG: hypothetical protein OEV40_07345 [Acidimicrobiia bacterium]|nr:hypothetical protein [Acidimicrobiia bacterium]